MAEISFTNIGSASDQNVRDALRQAKKQLKEERLQRLVTERTIRFLDPKYSGSADSNTDNNVRSSKGKSRVPTRSLKRWVEEQKVSESEDFRNRNSKTPQDMNGPGRESSHMTRSPSISKFRRPASSHSFVKKLQTATEPQK
eukprot:gene11565-3438_t